MRRDFIERAVALGLACADYWLRPGLKTQHGGPSNDQRARALLCEHLAALGGVQTMVETGTYRGMTTRPARLFATPVYSVEIDPRYYYHAHLRTGGVANVRLRLGDSRQFLRRLARDPLVPKREHLLLSRRPSPRKPVPRSPASAPLRPDGLTARTCTS